MCVMAPLSDVPEVGQPVIDRQSISEAPKQMVFDKISGCYYVGDTDGVRMFKGCSLKGRYEIEFLQELGFGDNDFVLTKKSETQWNAIAGNGDNMVFWVSKSNTHVYVTCGKEYGSSDAISVRIEGSFWLKKFTIYMGDSSTIIAEIHLQKKQDRFLVDVFPNKDNALVVSLVMVVDAMGFFEPSFGSTEEEKVISSIEPPIDSHLALRHQPSRLRESYSYENIFGYQYTSDAIKRLIFEIQGPADEIYVSKAEPNWYCEVRNDNMVTDKSRIFDIISCNTTLHSQRVLRDESGKAIAMLRKKNATAHARWIVSCFFEESEADSKKVFSVCKSYMIQRHTDLNVIMGKGKKSSAADYKVTGSWKDKTCSISKGDFSTKLAQMHPLGANKEKFMVEVYPNVDWAFVVSLIAVVDAMKSSSTLNVVADHAADLAFKCAGGIAFAAGKAVFDGLS